MTAVLSWDGHRQVCVMQNRSPMGALLRINVDLSRPRRFALEMTPGALVPVRTVWRTRDHVGVRIDEEGAARLDPFHQLWRCLLSPVLRT